MIYFITQDICNHIEHVLRQEYGIDVTLTLRNKDIYICYTKSLSEEEMDTVRRCIYWYVEYCLLEK